jgi:hypothetical protein
MLTNYSAACAVYFKRSAKIYKRLRKEQVFLPKFTLSCLSVNYPEVYPENTGANATSRIAGAKRFSGCIDEG